MSIHDQKINLGLNRHAKRAQLKARFSPTAIFTTDNTPSTTAVVPNDPDTSVASVPPTTSSPPNTPSPATPSSLTTGSETSSTGASTTPPPPTVSPSSSTTSTSTSTSSTGTTSTSSSTLSSSTSLSSNTLTQTPLTTQSPVLASSADFEPLSTITAGSSTPQSVGSATSTPDSSSTSSISTTGIVGIAAGAIVGVVVIAGIVMFLLRRCQRRDDDAYDAGPYRRQSLSLVEDTPSPLYRGNSGGRPRPPTMIEKHYANLTPTALADQSSGQPYGEPNAYSHFQPSFNPGEVIPTSPAPQYAVYNPMGQSPVGTPATVAPYISAYDEEGRLVRQSNATVLTRASSRILPPSAGVDETEYADLNRESVTPYQAAQYVAISRQLNVQPPVPALPIAENVGNDSGPVGSDDSASPFADPNQSASPEDATPAPEARPSSELFAPPRVASPEAARTRIPSIAPILPEIYLQQGSFSPVSYSFPVSANVSPSPLATSFTIPPAPSALDNQSLNPASIVPQAGASVSVPPGAHVSDVEPKKRPETVYDDEDAYGGI